MDDRLTIAIARLEHMLGKHMGSPGGPPKQFCEDIICVIKAARAAEETGSGSLHLPTTVCQNAADTKVGDE